MIVSAGAGHDAANRDADAHGASLNQVSSRVIMEHAFWIERWQQGRIGFHRSDVNGMLLRHHAVLAAGSRVLVPLCGKSLDMGWLAAQGHQVVGIELSRIAVEAFFAEHGLEPRVEERDSYLRFSTGGIEILCGDLFAIGAEDVGAVTAWYDRAAMIALPPAMRARYVEHLAGLVPPGARGLLVTLDYAPPLIEGPPFSVDEADVQARCAGCFRISLLECNEVLADEPRFLGAGISSMHEQAWALTRLDA